MVSKCILGVLLLAICIAVVSGEDGPVCVPFWHAKMLENWPLAGVSEKTRPKFKMIVKGLNKGSEGFTPGKTYRVNLAVYRHKKNPTNPRIHGFYIVLNQNTTGCGTGELTARPGNKFTPAKVVAGCSTVTLDGSEDIVKTRGIKWTAPSCGCVTLAATIKTSNNMIVEDDITSTEIEDRYKVLTKKVCGKLDREAGSDKE